MKEYNIINVINLEHRELRLQQFHEQSVKEQFGYRVWPGIICRGNNKQGINRAHKQIVQYAKDNNLSFVVIAEDDCRFFGDGGAWRYFLNNIPNDYDIYFSMFYACDTMVEDRIMDVFSGMTMYMVNQRFYDVFLSLPDDCHIDREMLGPIAKNYLFMVCPQVICEQDGSRSDNTQTTMNYRPFLKGRKIFGDISMD